MNDTPESVPGTLLDTSRAVFEQYDRYEKLRALTQHLNGLPDSSPLPDHVKIHNLELDYSINGVPHRAVVGATELRVGDLYRLLARELENLVSEMRANASHARQVATLIEASCTKAQYTTNAQQTQG